MSQPPANQDNFKPNNRCGVYNNGQKFNKRNDPDVWYRPPYKNYQYYSAKYNYHPFWNYRKKRPPPKQRKQQQKQHRQQQQPKRSPSPFSGTEEYTMRKIREASDMIKKTLMMPETDENVHVPETPILNQTEMPETELKSNKNDSEKSAVKTTKKIVYNVEEIQHKILTHITKLSHRKKVSLICSDPSGYDVIFEQIHKQKRLELSKALRDMCSNQGTENSEVINSIIPDIGIKIEDLPWEVIQELSSTLDWHFDDVSNEQNNETVTVKTEILEDDFATTVADQADESLQHNTSTEVKDDSLITQIKEEVHDIEPDPEFRIEAIDEPMEISPTENQNEMELALDQSPLTTEISLSFQKTNANADINQDQFLVHRKSVTVGLQTDFSAFGSNSVSIQTENTSDEVDKFHIDTDNVHNLDDAVQSMLAIDAEIAHLTKMRQDIFFKLQKRPNSQTKLIKKNEGTKNAKNKESPQKQKNLEKITEVANNAKSKESPQIQKNLDNINEGTDDVKRKKSPNLESHHLSLTEAQQAANSTVNDNFDIVNEEYNRYEKALDFEPILEKILVIKVIRDTIIAASEKGNIFYINALDGSIMGTLKVTNAPIISLLHWSGKQRKLHLIVGSSGTKMHELDYETRNLVRVIPLKERVQCLEVAWNYIFIGAAKGDLMRYNLKQCRTEFQENISADSVMVLKATQEGARRILLVGLRNAPVTVRDAMSGLHLRTMSELVTPTVYNLILNRSMVYCGTTFHDILVFSFHDGSLVHKHQATNSKGVSCMKIVNNLLFASCYNGNIYVYNVKTNKHVGLIKGPGGVILSMDIVKNLVIVGTMSLHFITIIIPDYILEYNTITVI